MVTPTQHTLDRVYAPTLELLKAAGFKKRGRTLYRVGTDSSDVINLQASQWNTVSEMQFTANLGTHQVDLAKELKRQRTTLPQKVEECMLQERIGWVMPDQLDVWWRIDSEHTEEHASLALTKAVEGYVLPWFELCRRRETLIQYMSGRAGWRSADVLLLLGERDLAINAMERISSKLPDSTDAISRWKLEHGIAVA